MGGLQLGRRDRAELLVEPLAHPLVGGQRVGGPARRGQRGELVRGQPLVERVRGDERLELRHELRAAALGEAGRDAVGLRGQPQVLEPRRLGGGEAVLGREAGERGAAPERERVAEQRGGARRVVRAQGAGALGGEPLEARPRRRPRPASR